MGPFAAPVPLLPEHETGAFDCGSPSLSNWIRDVALMAHRAGTSRVYVACEANTPIVVGYYAVAAASLSLQQATPRALKGAGRGEIPAILLTRLTVDTRSQGRGLGKALVSDALRRVVEAADVVGVRVLLIHAESPAARDFYLHLAEFEASPTDPLHLILLLKDLRHALDR
ncbi:MAG: N-acetyltransferase [Candidatus Limnocylindrales bacterium]